MSAPALFARQPSALRRWLGRLGIAVVLALVGLAMAVAWHAQRLGQGAEAVTARPGVTVDADGAARRLGLAVQQATLATPDDAHGAAFEALHRHLANSFPLVHAKLQRTRVGRHALLFTWTGSDAAARPIALMAHQDVVPVAPGTASQWLHPPFGGERHDGFVWGRGAWDNKAALMAIFEAVELLLKDGFTPRQTVYLVFGADEEIGGTDGAARIAAQFKAQGVRLGMVLDEGMLITHGMVPGVSKPVALVGLAEKGYATVQLKAQAAGGHSSMPPPRSAIGLLSEAIARIEAHPMPTHFGGLPHATFEAVAPEADGVMRWVLGNLWLTAPLVERQLSQLPAGNAMLRTTGVATVFRAGERDNVLPGVAEASVNFRLLPGDHSRDVLAHVQGVIAGLPVTAQLGPEVSEASPLSPRDGSGLKWVSRALRELQPNVVVAPGLLIGGTDSRHFTDVADEVLRFAPIHVRSGDLARFHGSNERMSVANHVELIQFYERLLRTASTAP